MLVFLGTHVYDFYGEAKCVCLCQRPCGNWVCPECFCKHLCVSMQGMVSRPQIHMQECVCSVYSGFANRSPVCVRVCVCVCVFLHVYTCVL